ncbi:MerR family transcriptional regulator [Sphingomicrobium astaxanthinifaciens]|uniref:MerR family transcriptional regulator n=1 Tax=Sphingomicrobium astaxanthinifaciens TaxID=1227949 RepID=UPI001FCC3AA4|nr:MerR family DNA-binding transcriptional regulator [Sphingomicrobium astaxanthinifaciens]MCJ7420639.1 MerR family DNA-binding transcriptional regulator [Sphingomicrobium astaxanthinifaciens]
MSASHADSDAQYSIGQMCEEFGVTARALRFYEDERLISPKRVGTQRLYSERDRARVAWILRGKRVGFSLAEIGELLDLYDLGDQRRTQRQVTLDRCRERIDALTRQKADIDETIEELEGFVRLLEDNSED